MSALGTDLDIVKLWGDLHRDSNLPCLDRVFAYMLRLPIQTLREGITLRLEQRPEAEPDLASLNQLIHECKDTLILAIAIKADYIEMGMASASVAGILREIIYETSLESVFFHLEKQ